MLDKLRVANNTRQVQWENAQDKLSLSYLGNAIAGEVGEACNVIKKLEREQLGLRGSRASVADLADELADVIIYIDILASRCNIDLDEAIKSKFNKTSEKYGLGTRID
jgi:NTP pyrophosphatase (non-canonical NTP hydrolase)